MAYIFDINFDATIKFDNAENIINGQNELAISSNQNLGLGLGYQYKRFGVEFRLNTPRNILKNYMFWSGKYSSTGILLSYKVL